MFLEIQNDRVCKLSMIIDLNVSSNIPSHKSLKKTNIHRQKQMHRSAVTAQLISAFVFAP